MTGLELMGIFFSVSIASAILYIFIWLIGSTWRNNRDIDELLVRVRFIENALLTSNPFKKEENKNGRQSIRKPNRRTRKG